MTGLLSLLLTGITCVWCLRGTQSLRSFLGLTLLTFTAAFLAFLPSIDALYVADDFYFLDPTRGNLQWWGDWGHAVMPNMGGFRPTAALSYDLDRFFSHSPTAFRLSNLAMHISTSVALGALLVAHYKSFRIAAFASLLFTIYPVHHENVFWISGRTYLLGGFLSLLALLVVTSRRGTGASFYVGTLTLLASGAHESFTTLPLVILFSAPDCWSRVIVPSVACAVFLLIRRYVVVGGFGELALFRIPRNFVAILLRLMSLPRDENLVPQWWSFSFVVTGCFFFGIATTAFISGLKIHRLIGWLVAFLCSALPFVVFPGYADRFVYFPSAMFLMVISQLAATSFERRQVGIVLHRVCLTSYPAVCVLWFNDLRGLGKDWVEAGLTANSIVNQAVDVLQSTPHSTRVVFQGVPRMHRRAYVFMTHFETAIESECQRRGLSSCLIREDTSEVKFLEWNHNVAVFESVTNVTSE